MGSASESYIDNQNAAWNVALSLLFCISGTCLVRENFTQQCGGNVATY